MQRQADQSCYPYWTRSDGIATTAGGRGGRSDEARERRGEEDRNGQTKGEAAEKEAIPSGHRLDISGLFAGTCQAPGCARPWLLIDLSWSVVTSCPPDGIVVFLFSSREVDLYFFVCNPPSYRVFSQEKSHTGSHLS